MSDRIGYILNTFKGIKTDNIVPVVPIYHTAICKEAGISLKEFATSSEKMADCMLWAYRTLQLDGVQLTLGVATEAEAIGADTKQPENGLPVITFHLLEDSGNFSKLRLPNPRRDGRMPMFTKAVKIVQDTIGDNACTVATIRGPFVIAGQLRGLNSLMLDIYDNPGFVEKLLEFCTEVAFRFGESLVKETGISIIAIGEALCSPDFISPDLYRNTIAPFHRNLIKRLHDAGLQVAILHICGNLEPILQTLIDAEVDTLDIDSKVNLEKVLNMAKGIGLRGNLDPAWMLSAKSSEIKNRAEQLLNVVKSYPWVLSSGCDIPYGTSLENMKALVEAGKNV